MAVRLAEAFPDANRELSVRVISLKDEIVGGSRRSLNILFSAVQVLFVIAWANIAILLLARGMARRGELRLRAALGATRARLFGLLLMEGVVLAGLGCALGLLAGSFAITALPQIDPALLPRAYEIGFSLPLVLWAFGLTLAGALLFGSIPAWAATGVSTAELDSTRTTGRRTSRLNSRLVAAQVALALPLLVASIMQLRSVHALESVELGYRIDHVLSAGVSLPGNQFGQAEQKHYIERAIDGFVRLPGVIAAGAISHLPLTNRQAAIVTYRPDQEGQSGLPNAHYRVITPGTLATLGIPVISGREFAPGDDETGRRIIVLNDRLARVLYPDREAVGQQVRLGTFEEPWEVIGVARSARLLALDAEPDYTIYVPVMQNLFASLLSLPQFLVRYEGSHVSLAPAVRQVLRDVDPNQAVLDIRPLGAQIDDWLGTRRAVAWLLWIIGGAALTLAGAGIYATLAFTVNRRRREMAIRSALGAAPGRLARTLVRDGLKPGVAGVVIGAAVCLIASRFFIGALFGVSSLDPPSMSGGIALVLLAALVACTAPTLRGMRQDPARLLREGEG